MQKYRLAALAAVFLLALPTLGVAGTPNLDGGADKSAIDKHCLALNIYFEARSEPLVGKIAVSHVVLNRVRDARFPRSVCAVVKQGGDRRRHRCQFSWWCDGRSDRPDNLSAWQASLHIADLVYRGALPDPTAGALWYHAEYVNPNWAGRLTQQAKFGKHVFYVTANQASRSAPARWAATCLAVAGSLPASITDRDA